MPKATLSGFQCNRCRHKWRPILDRPPKVCPRCKSPYWNKKRVRLYGRTLSDLG